MLSNDTVKEAIDGTGMGWRGLGLEEMFCLGTKCKAGSAEDCYTESTGCDQEAGGVRIWEKETTSWFAGNWSRDLLYLLWSLRLDYTLASAVLHISLR